MGFEELLKQLEETTEKEFAQLEETKGNVFGSINKRHEELHAAIDRISNNNDQVEPILCTDISSTEIVTENTKKLDEIGKSLDELLASFN